MNCENCTKYDDCRTGSGLTWPCGAYRQKPIIQFIQCPKCGGKVRSESIGWRCESCNGFIDMQGEFHTHKEEPFMPSMTNGDCIRAMNDDDMAEQFVINLDGLRPCRVYLSAPTGKMYLSRTEAVRVTRLWIQQPYKEDA